MSIRHASLESLTAHVPALGGALHSEASLDFYLPACREVAIEVDFMPKAADAFILFVPNQAISRAWCVVYRVLVNDGAAEAFGRFAGGFDWFWMVDEPYNTDAGIRVPRMYERGDRSELRKFVEVLNDAGSSANAVVGEAARTAKAHREELGKDLGLSRPQVGFNR